MLEVRILEACNADGVECKVGNKVTINTNTANELILQGKATKDLEEPKREKKEVKTEIKKEKTDNGKE